MSQPIWTIGKAKILSIRRDPYFLRGPALISFSGGRTSAYMLWKILQAHGGRLPPSVIVVFANTGKERLETLDFVARCATGWRVHVVWLEWRDNEIGYEIVSHNSASRAGEPFEALITKKKMLPNSVMRFCTIELKIRIMKRYCQQEMGWTHWKNIVGLRFDELNRVNAAAARNAARKEPFMTKCPMATARDTKPVVLDFWQHQPFDLGLADYEGNCDYCFLKGQGKIKRIMQDGRVDPAWWIRQEHRAVAGDGSAGTFRPSDRPSYEQMAQWVYRNPIMAGMDPPEFEFDDETSCAEGVCG